MKNKTKIVSIGMKMTQEEKDRVIKCASSVFLKPSTWSKTVIFKECEKIERSLKKGK